VVLKTPFDFSLVSPGKVLLARMGGTKFKMVSPPFPLTVANGCDLQPVRFATNRFETEVHPDLEMRIMMVLTLMAASITMLALWPDPPPSEPPVVRSGPGVSHVEATNLNLRYRDEYEKRANRRLIQIGCAVAAITLIVSIGVRLGRRIG
jgi:hypothetical protein